MLKLPSFPKICDQHFLALAVKSITKFVMRPPSYVRRLEGRFLKAKMTVFNPNTWIVPADSSYRLVGFFNPTTVGFQNPKPQCPAQGIVLFCKETVPNMGHWI